MNTKLIITGLMGLGLATQALAGVGSQVGLCGGSALLVDASIGPVWWANHCQPIAICQVGQGSSMVVLTNCQFVGTQPCTVLQMHSQMACQMGPGQTGPVCNVGIDLQIGDRQFSLHLP